MRICVWSIVPPRGLTGNAPFLTSMELDVIL